MEKRFCLSVCTVIALAGTSAGAQVIGWASPVNGDWSDSANWIGANIPDTIGEDAVLGFVISYTVDAFANLTIGGLSITNPLATLNIGSNRTLTLNDNLLNNGLMVINPTGALLNTHLSFAADATISGTGTIVLNALNDLGDAQVVGNGFTITHTNGHTIRGSGSIFGTMFNSGNIIADDPAGAGLRLAGTLTQAANGSVGANAGKLLLGNGSVTTGGTMSTINEGLIEVQNTATIGNIINTGDLEIPGQGWSLLLNDNIVNNGTITVNSNDAVFNAHLQFDVEAVLGGSGNVVMVSNGDLGDAQILTGGAFDGTIGTNQVVEGSGLITGANDGTIVNLGIINGNDPTADLGLAGNHSGSGTYRADDGLIDLRGGLILDGGTFDSSGGGIVEMTQGGLVTLSNITNLGQMGIRGQGGTIGLTGPMTNNGTITINSNGAVFNAHLRFDAATVVDGNGTIEMFVNGDFGDAQILSNQGFIGTIGEGQTITGSGRLQGEMNMNGTLDPDSTHRRFDIDVLHFSPTSAMIADLGGLLAGEFDRLLLGTADTIDLDGTLTVNLDAGYTPVFGDTWDIIDGGTITGEFATKHVPSAPIGQVYRVIYESDRVFVILTCDADYTGDGVLNFFDVSKFLELFGAQDPEADINGDGSFNFFDISAFLQIFSAPCQ